MIAFATLVITIIDHKK
ncbi:hypothetical protein [Virgibacillus halodenitrificans]